MLIEFAYNITKLVNVKTFTKFVGNKNSSKPLASLLVHTYLSRSITSSQCTVCGKRSTAMAFTGWKGSEGGIDLALCRARPVLLIFLHPRLFLFPFSILSGDGVQSSIAFATKLSGLQEM